MNAKVKLAALVTTLASVLVGSAQASDQYSFPSSNGLGIAAAAPVFMAPPSDVDAAARAAGVSADGSLSVSGVGVSYRFAPPALTSGHAYDERFGMRSRAAEAYAFQFLTHALNSAAYRNYAGDYARLFAPGYAVSAWTDRMFGVVDAGYGGAVDSWTAAAYYMPRVRGPARRRESAPDLSTMPTFHPHPELQTPPTFQKGS